MFFRQILCLFPYLLLAATRHIPRGCPGGLAEPWLCGLKGFRRHWTGSKLSRGALAAHICAAFALLPPFCFPSCENRVNICRLNLMNRAMNWNTRGDFFYLCKIGLRLCDNIIVWCVAHGNNYGRGSVFTVLNVAIS